MKVNVKVLSLAVAVAIGLFAFRACHAEEIKDEFTNLTHTQYGIDLRRENAAKTEIKLGQIWLREERDLDSNGNLIITKTYYHILKDYDKDWGVCIKHDLNEHFCAWLLTEKEFLPGYLERNHFKRIK